jgi:hypothetical protein
LYKCQVRREQLKFLQIISDRFIHSGITESSLSHITFRIDRRIIESLSGI